MELLQSSIEAYFNYLFLSGSTSNSSSSSSSSLETVVASSRLLNLFFRYGTCKDDLFTEDKFSRVFPALWESCLPQLFARLDHVHCITRERILNLITKIGFNNPCLIIYQVLSECRGLRKNISDSAMESLDKIRLQLQATGLDAMINDVSILINEVQRINVLWEEQWHYRLSALESDVTKRFSKLRKEFDRLKRQTDSISIERISILQKESYLTVMKPVMVSIENLCNNTIHQTGLTPHEQWFKDQFGSLIETALQTLSNPIHFESISSLWKPFKEVSMEIIQLLFRVLFVYLFNDLK